MADLSVETLQPYVGGQLEVQNVQQGYLYRGEVKSVAMDGPMLTFKFAWMALAEGFPPVPMRWVPSPVEAFTFHMACYRASNIGPGETGSDRLSLMEVGGSEIAVLYPADGSKLTRPTPPEVRPPGP